MYTEWNKTKNIFFEKKKLHMIIFLNAVPG